MFNVSKIRFIFKIYAKILSFVCIFWMIGAIYHYFISYCRTLKWLTLTLDHGIPLYMRYLHYIKQVLYQTSWLPIMLLPCAIFLFHWMRKKLKEKLHEEAKEVKVTEAKTEDELDPDQVDFTEDI